MKPCVVLLLVILSSVLVTVNSAPLVEESKGDEVVPEADVVKQTPVDEGAPSLPTPPVALTKQVSVDKSTPKKKIASLKPLAKQVGPNKSASKKQTLTATSTKPLAKQAKNIPQKRVAKQVGPNKSAPKKQTLTATSTKPLAKQAETASLEPVGPTVPQMFDGMKYALKHGHQQLVKDIVEAMPQSTKGNFLKGVIGSQTDDTHPANVDMLAILARSMKVKVKSEHCEMHPAQCAEELIADYQANPDQAGTILENFVHDHHGAPLHSFMELMMQQPGFSVAADDVCKKSYKPPPACKEVLLLA